MKRPSKRVASMVVDEARSASSSTTTVSSLLGGAAAAAAVVAPRSSSSSRDDVDDRWNYALLVLLYTLQGIPMGLSASVPFLIQQRVKDDGDASSSSSAAYDAQAVFALCSWPFSLKLLWAPVVDACWPPGFGRRKSWLVPAQACAGALLMAGSASVERRLGLDGNGTTMDVRGATAFFFALYFLMATQDVAVDGWALTMLSKRNRGRGPVCNSVGQNVGYFVSFVGFLALNDPDSSESLWRPLLGLESRPGEGLVTLGGFLRAMGAYMLVVTTLVAILKRETPADLRRDVEADDDDDDDEPPELDASEIGLRETYRRLYDVCRLPAVRSLFVVLLTYRFPTALSDNVKFLAAVENGLDRQTTALLSPTVVLPLSVLVPIVAARAWRGRPLDQFVAAYKARVTLVPLLEVWSLRSVRRYRDDGRPRDAFFWAALVASTAGQTIAHSLQFNAQMTFFASRVDPAIGGSYMTLLNTAANLGGTWPASAVMWIMGRLSSGADGPDAYAPLQAALSALGLAWLWCNVNRVRDIARSDESCWRTDGGAAGAGASVAKTRGGADAQDDRVEEGDASAPLLDATNKKKAS